MEKDRHRGGLRGLYGLSWVLKREGSRAAQSPNFVPIVGGPGGIRTHYLRL